MKINKLKKIATVMLSSVMIFGMLGVNSNAQSYIPPQVMERDHNHAAPIDYTELGYWFEKYGTEVQVYGQPNLNHDKFNNSQIILGNISAHISKLADGRTLLVFEADYEIEMEVWAVSRGTPQDMTSPNVYTARVADKAPNYQTGKYSTSDKTIPVTYVYDTLKNKFNSADELTTYIASAKDGVTHSNTNTGLSALETYTSYVNPNWTTPLDKGPTSYNVTGSWGGPKTFTPANQTLGGADYTPGKVTYDYYGPDGLLQVKLSVNGKPETLVKLPYSIPPVCGSDIDWYFQRNKIWAIEIDPSYGDVEGIKITSIQGQRMNFYITADGTECCPASNKVVEGVGIVDQVEAGNNYINTIQLIAHPFFSGSYDVVFKYQIPGSSAWYETRVNTYIGENIGCNELLKVTVPKDAQNLSLESLEYKGHTREYGNFSELCFMRVEDWRFDITYNVAITRLTTVEVQITEDVDFSNVSYRGSYDFNYAYVVYENNLPVTYYVTKTYNFESREGNFRDCITFPTDAVEVRLCNVTAPTGYVKPMNQVIYTNDDLIPEIPTSFNAAISCNRIERNVNGVNIHTTINYAAPERATYRVVYEYVVNGRSYYQVKTITANPGYGVITYGDGSTINALVFPSDVSSVKVYRIETADGTPFACDINGIVLYTCEHTYSDDCVDMDCNYCHTMRDLNEFTPEHTYANCLAPTCSVCGAVRENVGHQYDNTCSDRDCNVCGYVRPVSELSEHYYGRDYGTCKVTNCVNCGAERTYVSMNEHSYSYPCDVRCYDCQAIRNFVGERHRFESWDGSCIWCHAMPDPEPQVWNITHYWLGYNESVDGKPVYYSGPLNNGDWGAEITLVSYMPAAIGNVGITYTVEYNGQVIYTGNCATASVNISKIPSGFAAGTYTISFYEADGSFIYSDSCTVIDHE